ncbi:MAG: hypothetical protein WAU69_00985, partial [Solirubrobacteraceae bacterium]
ARDRAVRQRLAELRADIRAHRETLLGDAKRPSVAAIREQLLLGALGETRNASSHAGSGDQIQADTPRSGQSYPSTTPKPANSGNDRAGEVR